MAVLPTPEEIEKRRAEAVAEVERKRKLQEKQGKDFVHDPYGPGVVPEKIWKKQKAAGEK